MENPHAGCTKPKSDQFYQQLTNWEAACLKSPKSGKKGTTSKSLEVSTYCHRNAPDLEEPLAADQLFSFSRFVSKQDLGCIYLGTSIHEVLQTLLCAYNDSEFCPGKCGCAEHDFECRSSFSSLRSDCTDDDVDGVGGDPPPQKRRRA